MCTLVCSLNDITTYIYSFLFQNSHQHKFLCIYIFIQIHQYKYTYIYGVRSLDENENAHRVMVICWENIL